MNKRTIISSILLILGESLIITGFLHYWPNEKDPATMIIDIISSSLIWILLSYDMFIRLVDINKNQPRQIATLGVRWYFVGLYAILSIIVMILGFHYEWSSFLQGCLQVGCLMIIILGMAAAGHAGDQVEIIAKEESDMLAGRSSMSTALQQLKDELTLTTNVPLFVTNQVEDFSGRLRFISPNNSIEAKALEQQFCELCDNIRFSLTNVAMNEDAIKTNLSRMDITLNNRKNLFNK